MTLRDWLSMTEAASREIEGSEVSQTVDILIVDDEEIMRNVLSDILRDEGYRVLAVASGDEAMKKIQKSDFDVILTDIKMPGLNGLELLRRVKQLAPESDVVVMTGYASVETAVESMRLGASDYVTKPLQVDQIKIIISKTLEGRRLKQKAKEGEFYKRLSRLDGLTELYNHRFFHELLDSEIKRAQRYQTPLSLLMVDIDNFKVYNDSNGHPAGDLALKTLASVLQGNVRNCDMTARYGGEEFAIILPESDTVGAATLGKRVRRSVEEAEFDCEGSLLGKRLTVSVGVASFPIDAQNKSDLVKKADQALYRAKISGRNLVCVFNQGNFSIMK